MRGSSHFAAVAKPLIFGVGVSVAAVDSAPILPNACFLESVVFVETHLSRYPSERADTFHFLMNEIGLPAAAGAHTVAIYTISGRLHARDYVLGSFEVGPAKLLRRPNVLSDAVVRGFARFAPQSYGGVLGKRAYVLDSTTDELAAARLALQRLAPVAAYVGKAQMLQLDLESVRVIAVIFGFKGHLCCYRPAYGTSVVKLMEGESTRDALRRMPGLTNAAIIDVMESIE